MRTVSSRGLRVRGHGFMSSQPAAGVAVLGWWVAALYGTVYGWQRDLDGLALTAACGAILPPMLAPWWHTLEISDDGFVWKIVGVKVRACAWVDVEELKLAYNFAYRTRGSRWRWIGLAPVEHFNLDRPDVSTALLAQIEAHGVPVKADDLARLQRRVWRCRARELGYVEWSHSFPPPERPSDWEGIPGYEDGDRP